MTGAFSSSSSSSVWVIFWIILNEFDWEGLLLQLCCLFKDLEVVIYYVGEIKTINCTYLLLPGVEGLWYPWFVPSTATGITLAP